MEASNLPPGVTDSQLDPKECQDYGTLYCREKCNIRDKCLQVMEETPTIYEWLTGEIEICKRIIAAGSTTSHIKLRQNILEEVRDRLMLDEAQVKLNRRK